MAFAVGSRIKAKKNIPDRSGSTVIRTGTKGRVRTVGGHMDAQVAWDNGIVSAVFWDEITSA